MYQGLDVLGDREVCAGVDCEEVVIDEHIIFRCFSFSIDVDGGLVSE